MILLWGIGEQCNMGDEIQNQRTKHEHPFSRGEKVRMRGNRNNNSPHSRSLPMGERMFVYFFEFVLYCAFRFSCFGFSFLGVGIAVEFVQLFHARFMAVTLKFC